MTEQQLESLLKQTGYPVAYNEFAKEPRPPYIAYIIPNQVTVFADNAPQVTVATVRIELYTAVHDPSACKKLEQLLTAGEILFDKAEFYLREERLFMTVYESEVLLNEYCEP